MDISYVKKTVTFNNGAALTTISEVRLVQPDEPIFLTATSLAETLRMTRVGPACCDVFPAFTLLAQF